MSKNKVWLTEYRLWKAAHDCIDMSQEENCNMNNEDGLLAMAEDLDIEDKEFDYRYMDDSKDSNWKGTEEEDNKTIGLEDSDNSNNIDDLGYAHL